MVLRVERELRQLFKSYTEAKQERHVLDYDDLLLYGFICLATRRSSLSLNERFDHILVDEYQEPTGCSPPFSIACGRSITTSPSWVTMRRASTASAPPKCATFSIFPAKFPGATVVTLETNYRSTQPILDATNRIIGLSPKRHAKELRSVKGNGLKPALITCEREEDQTDFVVEKVLSTMKAAWSPAPGDLGAHRVLVGSS